MDFSPSTWWWVASGALVVAEMLTGTFYLLMLALGCVAAAVAAHTGNSFSVQLVTGALVGGGATAAWHVRRARSPRSAPVESNRDVNLDIGQRVTVQSWDAGGRCRVTYRGASWTARFASEGTPMAGEHEIVAIHGNVLDLAPAAAR
jgi:membrane protein implicated in regulation of membrane protease activity